MRDTARSERPPMNAAAPSTVQAWLASRRSRTPWFPSCSASRLVRSASSSGSRPTFTFTTVTPFSGPSRSSSRASSALMPMWEEHPSRLAAEAIDPRWGSPAARPRTWSNAISRPLRTDGRSSFPCGQCSVSHLCIEPSSRASAIGIVGGAELQALSIARSWTLASCRLSRWNMGRGQTSPSPPVTAPSAPPDSRASTWMRRPDRCGMGSPRLRSSGVLSCNS
mmetsp:Transcript_106804/g.302034  ORF Transcript_106804/g.302034 Transcript_106804/m.302034 type:complete len:223 (+) Transcript_106804:600-1268(+)